MQIPHQVRNQNPRYNPFRSSQAKTKGESLTGLNKSDVIDDIFNNRKGGSEEEKDVKIRLSNTSAVLIQELKDNFANFLTENPKIAKSLEEVPLPSSEYTRFSRNSDLTLRKMGAYRRWLEIREHTEGTEKQDESAHESDSSYLAIHRQGKDAEIKTIFEEHEKKRKDIRDERSKNVPNYYYLVYPETYAFN